MFATKLLLKYAVKPISPPRNIAAQETTKTITFPHQSRRYTAPSMSKHEPRPSVAEYDAIKSIRLQKHNKLCATSEPQHISRKRWTDLEQSIVNHPNFEKAAVLVQLLGEHNHAKKNPHRIGSLPSGKAPFGPTTDVKTIEAAVNLVKEVIEAKEAEKEAEQETEEEMEKHDVNEVRESEKRQKEMAEIEKAQLNKQIEVKRARDTKPYVINIYLDTKQTTKTIRGEDIKKKIKEFWQEQQNQQEVGKADAKLKQKKIPIPLFMNNEIVVEEQQSDELAEENKSQRSDRKYHRRKPANYNEEADETEDTSESLTDIPRYQMQHVQKLYPDPISTTNPHTDRLRAGTPANYDLNKKIEEVVTKVNTVNTNGFGKYLTFWKQMWNKRQEAKEEEEGQDDEQRSTYSSENVGDDQAKQAFKVIENDKIFMDKRRKYNPYDPKLKEEETTEVVNEKSSSDDTPDIERESRFKRRQRHQQKSFYSTVANPGPYNEKIGPDESLKSKCRATTRLQISEFQHFYNQNANYSTTSGRGRYYRCDEKASEGGTGSKLPEKPKINHRVEEFVDKFKSALAAENRGEFKKVNVICAQDLGKQRVKLRISKVEDRKSEHQFRQNSDADDMRKLEESLKRKSQSAKKK